MPGLVPNVIIGSSAAASSVTVAIVASRPSSVAQRAPARDRRVPGGALAARARGPSRYCERRLVGRDHAGARARLDRHVADRHARLPCRARGSPAPVYSMTWPVAPPTPISRDQREDRGPSRSRPRGSSPSNAHLERLRPRCSRHCVASTCSTSLVPMPNASAPNAPCVDGVAVAAHDRHARLREPELGTDHVHDALPRRCRAP